MKLTTYLQLVSWSRKYWSTNSLPQTPPWLSAWLIKHGDKFAFLNILWGPLQFTVWGAGINTFIILPLPLSLRLECSLCTKVSLIQIITLIWIFYLVTATFFGLMTIFKRKYMVIRPKHVALTKQNIQTSVALDWNPEPDLVHATGCKQTILRLYISCCCLC
jgi:hypothetical protein